MPHGRRVVSFLAAVALLVGIAPSDRAWACSCDEPDLASLLEREPDAAVVRIRRIDRDGGTSGVGYVEQRIHGGEVPDQLPLALDDGASCLPWIAFGDVAVLSFVPDGDGWRTLECGRMDPTTGLDALVPDPAATGPPAVMVAGRLPGADLVTLDDHLRVLDLASLEGLRNGLRRCGEDVLVETGRPEGGTVLERLGVADLEVLDQQALSSGPEEEVQVLDVRCGDAVDVLVQIWSAERRIELRRDVFGDGARTDLGAAEHAAFVGDQIVSLRPTPDGAAEVVRHDVTTSAEHTVLRLRDTTGYEITVGPDDRHALVRGFAEDPLLVVVDLVAEREVARTTGWWQPVTRPWVGPDRILQIDEDSGGIGDGTGLARYRIVDLELDPVAEFEPTPAWTTAAGPDRVIHVDGGRLTVSDPTTEPVRTLTAPWVGGISEALVLGEVSPGEPAASIALPEPDPGVVREARFDRAVTSATEVARSLGPAIAVALAATATLALTLAWLVRRRRRPSASA